MFLEYLYVHFQRFNPFTSYERLYFISSSCEYFSAPYSRNFGYLSKHISATYQKSIFQTFALLSLYFINIYKYSIFVSFHFKSWSICFHTRWLTVLQLLLKVFDILVNYKLELYLTFCYTHIEIQLIKFVFSKELHNPVSRAHIMTFSIYLSKYIFIQDDIHCQTVFISFLFCFLSCTTNE